MNVKSNIQFSHYFPVRPFPIYPSPMFFFFLKLSLYVQDPRRVQRTLLFYQTPQVPHPARYFRTLPREFYLTHQRLKLFLLLILMIFVNMAPMRLQRREKEENNFCFDRKCVFLGWPKTSIQALQGTCRKLFYLFEYLPHFWI